MDGCDTERAEKPVARMLLGIGSPLLKLRSSSLGEIGDCLVDSAAQDIKPAALRRLFQAVLYAYADSCKQVTEKSWRLSLLALIGRAATLTDLPFTAHVLVLEMLQDERIANSGDGSHVGMIHLALALLSQLVRAKADEGTFVSDYAVAIGERLLLLEDNVLQREVVSKIGELVKGSPVAMSAFIIAWTGSSSELNFGYPQQQFLFLVAAQAIFPFIPKEREERKTLKSTLLGHYVRGILQHKNPASITASHFRKLEVFVGSLTEEDWATGSEDGLEGTMLKLIRKAPEGSSLLTAALVCQVKQISLAAFAENGAAVAALRMLRSQALDVRINGRTLLRILVSKSCAADTLQCVVKLTVETLQGKGSGGPLVQLWQRAEIAHAMCAIANSVPSGLQRSEKASIALNEALPALFAAIDKESIDEIRATLASAAGKWLSFLSHDVPSALLETLKVGTTKVKSLSYLMLLVRAISANREIAEKLVPIALSLCSSTVVKKPLAAVHVDAIFSYRIIAECSVFSSEVLQAAETGKLWSVFSTEGCFLFNKSVHDFAQKSHSMGGDEMAETQKGEFIEIADADVEDGSKMLASLVAESQTAVIALATQRGLSQSFVKADIPRGSLDCVMSCLIHPSAAVRKSAFTHVGLMSESNSKLLPLLIRFFFEHVTSLSTLREDAEKAAAAMVMAGGAKESEAVAGGSPHPPPSRISEALLRLCSLATRSSMVVLPDVLSLCSHPAANGNSVKGADTLWKSVLKSSMGSTCILEQEMLVDTNSQAISACVVKQILSESVASRQTGKMAMLLLAVRSGQWGKQLLKGQILPALIVALDCEKHAITTKEEADSFLYPQAALAKAISAINDVVVDLRITNADRKKEAPRSSRKGTFGSDFVEDDEWAERVKADKLKKAQAQMSGGEDATGKKRKELDELTSRLGGLVNKTVRVLGVLGTLVEHCGKEDMESLRLVHDLTPVIFPPLLRLLAYPLVEKQAFSAILKLCQSSIDSELLPAVRDLADSLRLVTNIIAAKNYETLVRPGATGKKAAKEKEELQQKLKKMIELSGPPSRLIKALAATVGRGGINQYTPSPITIELCFPVFHGLLQLPSLVTGCELTYTLFDAMWPASGTLVPELKHLCKPVLEMCLVTLLQLRVDPSPEKTISRLVSSGLTADEAGPLLSELGICSPATNVRIASVRAIAQLMGPSSSVSPLLSCRLFQAKHDQDEAVQTLATATWESWVSACSGRPPLPPNFPEVFFPLMKHEIENVRESVAKALASALAVHTTLAKDVFAEVQALYRSALPPPAPAPLRDAATGKGKSGGDKVGGLDLGTKKPLPMSSLLNEKVPGSGTAASAAAAAAEDKGASLRIAVSAVIATMGSSKSLSLGSDSGLIMQILDFLLTAGVVDLNAEVRNAMVTAGRSFIDGYADKLCSQMLATLDAVLKRQPAKGEDLTAYDYRHEAAVVFLGVAGKHLDKEDPMVLNIAETLVDALKIPAESVQRAVAECLAPLVQAAKSSDKVKDLFEYLMIQVLDAASYGERRGAAFGISAFVKGLGITSLKQHDVVNRLREACENGSVNARQGGFGAFECLSERLGMLFEPYITTIVPVLLKSFSHGSDLVREAAQMAAKAIMGRLSAHGVKVVLTPILTSLPTETAWKTRQEAIRLLGTMAHCAPKQLASCLPQIIPKLVEAGYDPHPKVKESAKAAMLDISSVIKNPEVARLSPVLLAALSDPAKCTKDALEALLECEFMHSIDAPSLALLVPILGRALKDRGADLKRKSAAITGNMMTMVSDPKFLVPYLQQVLPGLRECLLDPIPDVRATSAKALGSLVAGVGEEEDLAELVPWLISNLCTETSPVERSGAAQGLAEVCLALGDARLTSILQQTLPLHLSSKGAAREGLLWLLSFLPAALHEKFAVHIPTTLPVILSGLSDSIESVREVAMRAGQVMVSTLGKNYTLELLPSLCEGMFDDDWHIRHSSVMLLGELLYLIADTKAMGLIGGDGGEDENDDDGGMGGGTSRVALTIRAHIGAKTTDSMLASLYIARSDISTIVRQSALQVWKSVVSNTPRTLVEIMNDLVMQLIEKLSADSSDLRVVAGRALGEVVRKLGDRVLPAVVPHLRAGLEGGDLGMREGVCLGLAEILQASTRRQIEDYITVLVPALQQGLCDQSEVVRSQAAKAFQTLCKALGPRAIEDVVPSLIEKVISCESNKSATSEDGSGASNLPMLGLREIIVAKPRDILEFLLPKLFVSPMPASSAFVLGAVADVSGSVMQYHFGLIIPGFCRELIAASDALGQGGDDDKGELQQRLATFKESASNVMASIPTSGVNSMFHDLKAQVEHETSTKNRQWGLWLLEQFVRRSKANFVEYLPLVLKFILARVAESDAALLQAVADALAGVASAVDLDSLAANIDFIRSCITSTASDAKHSSVAHSFITSATGEIQLPLFSVPKSLEPLLAILIHGVMNGNPQVRENAADGIGDIALLTDSAALKPYLIKSTGPLIRVVGDRIPSNVKTSILQVSASIPCGEESITRRPLRPYSLFLYQKS